MCSHCCRLVALGGSSDKTSFCTSMSGLWAHCWFSPFFVCIACVYFCLKQIIKKNATSKLKTDSSVPELCRRRWICWCCHKRERETPITTKPNFSESFTSNFELMSSHYLIRSCTLCFSILGEDNMHEKVCFQTPGLCSFFADSCLASLSISLVEFTVLSSASERMMIMLRGTLALPSHVGAHLQSLVER